MQLLPATISALEAYVAAEPRPGVARRAPSLPIPALLASPVAVVSELLQLAAAQSGANQHAMFELVAELVTLLPCVMRAVSGQAADYDVCTALHDAGAYGRLALAIPGARTPAAALAVADVVVKNRMDEPRLQALLAQLLAVPGALAALARAAELLPRAEGVALATLLAKALACEEMAASPQLVFLDPKFPLAEILVVLRPQHRLIVDGIFERLTRASAVALLRGATQRPQRRDAHALAAAMSAAAMLAWSNGRPFAALQLVIDSPFMLEALVEAFFDGSSQPHVAHAMLHALLKLGGLNARPRATKEAKASCSGKRKRPAFANEKQYDTTELTLDNGAVSFHVYGSTAAAHSGMLRDLLEAAPGFGPFPLDTLLGRLQEPRAGLMAAMEWAHAGGTAPAGFPEEQGVSLRGLYAAAHALQMDDLLAWCTERVIPTLDELSATSLSRWWAMGRALGTESGALAEACAASWLRRTATATEEDAAQLAAVLRRAFDFDAPLRRGQEAQRGRAAAALAAALRNSLAAKLQRRKALHEQQQQQQQRH